jgi:hypothetical protein
MNYKYVYLGFVKDGKQEIHKVEFGEFTPHPYPGMQDMTEFLQTSIRDTVLESGTYKTAVLLSSISKENVKSYYTMGDNLTKIGIDPNTVVGVSTKDEITVNNFNLTVGGNNTDTKPTCGPYKVKDIQLVSQSPIWNSAYLDKNNITFQTFVNCDLPAGSFHGWFCHQVTPGTGNDMVFLYLVSSNYWEEGEVPPFGNTTPGGTIGGYGTYDDTSDNFPIPPNRLNDVYSSILSNVAGKIQMYTLDSGAYSAFLGKIYTSDFWDYWKNTIFNPIDGIYSCIRVPFSELDLTRTSVAKINVSNTELEILAGAYRVTNNYVKDQVITSNYVIDEYFGSFLDYSPYTTCELYIPFYGTVNIDINEIMGGNISITRRNNYVNGDFVVFVQCVNRFEIAVTHAYAGNAAITLPITAGNDGSPNRILDLVQGVANLAMGNYVGAGTSAVNALAEKGNTSTVQKLSGGSGWNASHDFALIFRRSCPSNPENYTKENGRQADEFVNFSDLQGYTEVSAVDLKFTSGKITSAEIDEINNLLKQGVFF